MEIESNAAEIEAIKETPKSRSVDKNN